MEPWQWALVVLGGIIVLVVIGLVVWRFRHRRQGKVQPVVRTTPEQARLQKIREMRRQYGRGFGGGLEIHIPYPEIDPQDLRLDDWNTSAAQMAEAQQRAEVSAQAGEELARLSRDMKRAQERADAAFAREAERIQEAFQTQGLEPPKIRTRQDLVAAEGQLQAALDRLAAAGA